MAQTKIDWATHVSNPVVGCTQISPGCDHCYALAMARRLQAQHIEGYEGVVDTNGWTGKINFVPKRLKEFEKKKPMRIFVGSMSDLFHPNVKFAWLGEIWDAMLRNPQHTYYVLTKRPEYVRGRDSYDSWLISTAPNIFLGVTVESADYLPRIDELCKNWNGRKFISLEPLLGDVGDLSKWISKPKITERMVKNPYGSGKVTERSAVCSICGYFFGGQVASANMTGHRYAQQQMVEAWKKHKRTCGLDWVIAGCENIGGRLGRATDFGAYLSIVRQCREAGVDCFVKQVPMGSRISKDMAEWPEELRVRQIP